MSISFIVTRCFRRVRKIVKNDNCKGADKSLAQPGRRQANFSVRMAWISFGALPCRKKKTWWQLASRCCWNRVLDWLASELVSFLVGLRTYQHPGTFAMSVLPCVRIENLGSYWADFHEILYFSIFRENPVVIIQSFTNPLNAKLNPICHLLALLGDHHILHVSGLRVKIGQE